MDNHYRDIALPIVYFVKRYQKTPIESYLPRDLKETLLRSLIRKFMDDTLKRIFEDLILENISRDQLLKSSKHPNTTSSLEGDPNLANPVQIKALPDDSVISQIGTPKVESTSPIGSNRSMDNGRNISPEKEYWDTPVSPPFNNPTHTKKKKEELATRNIFCSKCKAKHLPQECPFKISTCHIFLKGPG